MEIRKWDVEAMVEALKKEGYIVFKTSQVYLDALQKDADRFNQEHGEGIPLDVSDIARVIVEDYYDD